MAQDTFSQLWNRLLLYAPGTPIPLAQTFVKNAYKRCMDAHYWSELFKDGEKVIATEYSTGTAGVTNGSTAVTGSGTVWVAAMVGRQIQFDDSDGAPYYTITARSSDTAITLDRAFQGTTDSSTTYTIGEFYVEFPVDLGVLDDIRDADATWRLRRQCHQQNYLDMIDPKRESTGSPVFYVAAPPRVASGLSYPRYEFYPRITAGTHLLYRYVANSDLSANADYPVVTLKPEVILYGALSELCLWPGLDNKPNLHFNIDLHQRYDKLFEAGLQQSILSDLDRSQRMLIYDDGSAGWPADANFAQSHGLAPVS